MPGADRADPRLRRRRHARSSIAYRIVGRLRPGPVNRGYRLGQLADGQHALARARHERRAEDDGHHHARAHRPRQPARRQLRRPDLGHRLARRRRSRSAPTPAAGGSSGRWAAGSSRWTRRRASPRRARGAAVVLAASHLGFPLSTTHVISGGVMGAGAAKRVSAVRWGVAGNIAVAWVLTLPAAAHHRRRSPTGSARSSAPARSARWSCRCRSSASCSPSSAAASRAARSSRADA